MPFIRKLLISAQPYRWQETMPPRPYIHYATFHAVLLSGEVEVTDDEAGLNAVGFLREGASFGERSWLMGTLRKNNYR